MGNWRTVRIVGTCPSGQVEELAKQVIPRSDYANFGPLTFTSSLCGLPMWAAEKIEAVGNLAERDYEPDDIAEHLLQMAHDVPGLKVKVHCGGEYEDNKCVATVILENEHAEVAPPEIELVGSISQEQMVNNLKSQVGIGKWSRKRSIDG